MRKKTLKKVITFHTTTDAIAFEKHCHANEIPGRLIPVPTEISAGCGMCWAVAVEEGADIEDRIAGSDVKYGSVYELIV